VTKGTWAGPPSCLAYFRSLFWGVAGLVPFPPAPYQLDKPQRYRYWNQPLGIRHVHVIDRLGGSPRAPKALGQPCTRWKGPEDRRGGAEGLDGTCAYTGLKTTDNPHSRASGGNNRSDHYKHRVCMHLLPLPIVLPKISSCDYYRVPVSR
jgi:hypothetical protein